MWVTWTYRTGWQVLPPLRQLLFFLFALFVTRRSQTKSRWPIWGVGLPIPAFGTMQPNLFFAIGGTCWFYLHRRLAWKTKYLVTPDLSQYLETMLHSNLHVCLCLWQLSFKTDSEEFSWRFCPVGLTAGTVTPGPPLSRGPSYHKIPIVISRRYVAQVTIRPPGRSL